MLKIIDVLRDEAEKSIINGVKTGFNDWDKSILFRNGSLNVIASRPSMGKSALIESLMIKQAVDLNLKVCYINFNDTLDIIERRILTNISDIPLASLIAPKKDTLDWNILYEKQKILEGADLTIITSTHFPMTVKGSSEPFNKRRIDSIESLQYKKSYFDRNSTFILSDFDIVYIDNLQLIEGDKKEYANREQEVSDIAKRLKALSIQSNTPIVLLSTLNRRAEGSRRPQLEDLRDSGVIEDVADIVLFVHRPGYYGLNIDENGIHLPEDIAKIIIEKNKHGILDTIDMFFDGNCCKFRELDYIYSLDYDSPQSLTL